MSERRLPGAELIIASSLMAWGVLSLVGPGRLSLFAGCYNIAKLSAVSTIIHRGLPSLPSLTFQILLSVILGTALVLLDGHLRVLRQRAGSDVLRAVQQGLCPQPSTLPVNYCVFLLGSGGHTKEMCSMIKKQFPPSPNMHRRYIITSGDNYSASGLTQLEQALKAQAGPEKAGTYDCYMVKRSRMVHQKWYSAIWSTLDSIGSLFFALTTRPQGRPGMRWAVPNVIATNGPGTGFILCMIAHLMKVFCLAPQRSLRIIYVESLARVRTLSLTGKLFHFTSIADVFLVQHPGIAERYGKVNGGFMVETGPSPAADSLL